MEWKKNKDRNALIRKLRAQGHTMKEIKEATGASKSVISYHCKKVDIIDTERLQRRLDRVKQQHLKNLSLAVEKTKNDWNKRKQVVAEQAAEEWEDLKHNPKFMGFLGLYWGEGFKTSGHIGISNTEPGIILASMEFFREWNPEALFDITVRCNQDQDKSSAQSFWEEALGVPVKTVDKGWIGKRRKSRVPHGLCVIRYSNWKTNTKLLTWIACWRAELKAPVNL